MKYNSAGKAYFVLKVLVLLMISLFYSASAPAQEKVKTKQPDNLPRPRDVKVLEEHKDKNGNLVRTIQYRQGGELVTETEMIRPNVNLRVPINADTLNKDSVMLVVNKSGYTVDVF